MHSVCKKMKILCNKKCNCLRYQEPYINFMKYIFTACKSQTVLIIGFILNLFSILHKESMHVSYIQTRVSSISEQNNSCNENNFIASHLTKTKFDVTFSSKESRRNMTRDFSRNLQHFWHLRHHVLQVGSLNIYLCKWHA